MSPLMDIFNFMNNRTITYIVAAFVVVTGLTIACSSDKESANASRKFRIIHNNDGADILSDRWFDNKPVTKARIEEHVDMVVDNAPNVTTYMMCSGNDLVFYKSKYVRTFADDKNGTLDCDPQLRSKEGWNHYFQGIKNLEAEETDVIDASLRQAKKKGLETFITYRMNDLHATDTTTHCRIDYSDFWYEHPEFWLKDSVQGWHSFGALDYAHKEVREHKLNLVIEQLEKYYEIIDGFELDFMRFIVYFKTGEGRKNAPLITEMVKAIKQKTDSLSKIKGDKILLTVRVPITIEGAMEKGLDVRKWVKENYIDFITIGAHWQGETATPIAKFKEDLGYKHIPVYGTIDDGGYQPREFYTDGMFRGLASHILAQGGDGLYFFNYSYGAYNANNHQLKLSESKQANRLITPKLLAELGPLESLKNRNKIYCASDGVTDSYRVQQVADLPLAIGTARKGVARIYIGDNVTEMPAKESILFIRTDRPAKFDLEVNGISVTNSQPEYPLYFDRTRGLVNTDQVYAFVLPTNCLKQGYNEVSLISMENQPSFFVIKRLEVALKYGDVSTHGYF